MTARGCAPADSHTQRLLVPWRKVMYLLGLGIVLLALKYLEIGPVAEWGWLWVLSPFAAAVAWWAWADWSGYTKKKAVQRENDRKQARIDKSREGLGIKTKRRR
jgi:small Trp-rich protein